MPVEKTEWEIGTLIGAISHGEIKLPEIQRGFIWKPTQVAKLIDSLYRGYPTGSLLFWRTMESPLARDFALAGTPPQPAIQPLYLLDGQQRLDGAVPRSRGGRGDRDRIPRGHPGLPEPERGNRKEPALGEGA